MVVAPGNEDARTVLSDVEHRAMVTTFLVALMKLRQVHPVTIDPEVPLGVSIDIVAAVIHASITFGGENRAFRLGRKWKAHQTQSN
jgi:hypothetical protein